MADSHKFDEHLVNSVCSSLIPKLEPLEQERLKVRKHSSTFWLITLGIVIAVGGFIYLRKTYDTVTWVTAIAALVGIIIFYAVYVAKHQTRFSNRFKDEVIRALIDSFLPQSEFDPSGYISSQQYYNSSLFQQKCDRYEGRNYVEGALEKTFICFSELHTQYKTTRQTKNGTQTTWHTIFDGLFIIADPNKNFESCTYILPDVAERFFGGIGKWLQKNVGDSRGKVVYMENPEFEKLFAVYATDPVEARYLITPSMQESILALSKHVGNEIFLAFKSGKLYIAINNKRGIFTANTNMSLLNVDTLKYYAREITDILSIVNILDLNTRIWGKE